jgi:O-antigen ligase
MVGSVNLEKTYQYLLVALAFLTPLTVFGANLIIVVICSLWIMERNFKSKINLIFRNKVLVAAIVFYCIHLVGLLWTENLLWGFHILHKMWYFVALLPILYTITKKEFIVFYVSAFLLAISLTEVVSYLVWFEIIPPFKNASVYNPTPFMNHVTYNPMLAFATYLTGHELLFNKNLQKVKVFIYSFFIFTMSVNMFITGGRAGQIMYFVVISILILQFFNTSRIKAILVICLVVPTIFFTAYNSSKIFMDRVDMAYGNVINYENAKTTSTGQRITYAINFVELFKSNPILGVGTGDFPNEIKKIYTEKSPEVPHGGNPHNMYILITSQIGLIGLISFLTIFYFQIKHSLKVPDKFIKDVGITLPILFLVIMFSDSYLLGHFTSLLFIFFSSFLYKDFEKL